MRFNDQIDIKKYAVLMGVFIISNVSLAQTPGATQQAITSIQASEIKTAQTLQPVIRKPGSKLSASEKKALMAKVFKNKALMDYLVGQLKHPNYSSTAKSVYSPAGTPMRWGGLGVSVDVGSRYPSQLNTTYNPSAGVALPFGDSESSVGGALSVGTAKMAPGHESNMKFGRQGSIGLTFSRWLGRDTIATAGVANALPWGVYNRPVSKSYYAAVTQVFGPQFHQVTYPVSASVGVGTGGFGPLGEVGPDFQPTALNDRHVSPFLNAGINLTSDLALVGDYYSETFAAGIAYNKVIIVPLSFMLYAGNLRHTRAAPSTTVGLRIATGITWPNLSSKS